MALKKNLKNIYQTQFVINGVVWSVWDWTIFVFIVTFIVIAGLIAFLCCLCFYPTRYEEEMEAADVQSNKTLNDSIRERRDTERRLAVSLAAAMEATKDRPEREIKQPEKKKEGGDGGDAEAPVKMEGELENME